VLKQHMTVVGGVGMVRFAELFRTEVRLNAANMRSILPRLVAHAVSAGSELAFLYLGKVECWWPLVEDIFFSPVCRSHADIVVPWPHRANR
jgi:hypothetical protein